MDGQLVNNLEARNVEAVQTELSIRDLDDEIAELGDEFKVPRFGFYTLKVFLIKMKWFQLLKRQA